MRLFSKQILAGLVIAACMPLVAMAQTPAPAATPAPTPGQAAAPAPAPAPVTTVAASGSSDSKQSSGDRSYQLGAGDTIEVAVLGRSDFAGRARIGTDGAVLLPYIGTLQALNKTPVQLAEEIRIALEKGGFFAAPVVRVDVVGVASRYVTILGAIGSPGLMPLDRPYRLSEIVARAGGKTGAGVDYVILTPAGGGKGKQYKISDLATASGDADPVVSSGDKIYVPALENQVFYLTGQVKSPGAFPVSDGMTVRMALARAGGLTETGSNKKIKITRNGEVIKNVKLDETKVEPGDIVDVGERLF